MKQKLDFFDSIDQELIKGSFNRDYSIAMQGILQSVQLLENIDDIEFRNEMNEMISDYRSRLLRN